MKQWMRTEVPECHRANRKGYARDTQGIRNTAQHTRNICAPYAEREKEQAERKRLR